MRNLPSICWSRWYFIAVVAFGFVSVAYAQSVTDSGWPNYGNDAGGSRYSPAHQIDRTNVTQLQVAWTYRTGALQQQTDLIHKAAFEATPILVDNKLFLSTPYNHVIALDPRSGNKLWEYDSHLDLMKEYSEVASRGVSAWRDTKAKLGQPCRMRA
jgi:quinoprotein glucose dehydrogenase